MPDPRLPALALALLLALACAPRAPEGPPNVVLFVVDTLRVDAIGPYGNRVTATPHLDAFAQESVVFENAFSSSSWTRASMASVFTGLHPPRHGAERLVDGLSEEVTTLAEHFAAHAYSTAYVTANPSAGAAFGFGQGFDKVLELYRRREKGPVGTFEMKTNSDAVTASAVDWLRRASRPFFLTLLSIDPHAPYAPPSRFDHYGPEGYAGLVDGRLRTLAQVGENADDRERVRALYAGEVSFTDESFGAFLARLDQLEILEETIVVFTADHGEELWDYGRRGHAETLVDTLIHVPLMIRLPHGRGAKRISRPVQTLDLAPTLLELAGLPPATGIDGRSLFGEDDAAPRPTVSALRFGSKNLRAAREHPWKLVRDATRDVDLLYDVRNENAPVDPLAHPEADAVRARLAAALEAVQSEGTMIAPQPEVPEDVRSALEALGYVDSPEANP